MFMEQKTDNSHYSVVYVRRFFMCMCKNLQHRMPTTIITEYNKRGDKSKIKKRNIELAQKGKKARSG